MILRKSSIFLIAIAIFITACSSVEAYTRWEYQINEVSTNEYINLDETVADIDYEKQVIRLPPRPASGAIQFLNNETDIIDYAVIMDTGISVFSFDGEQMVENPFVSFTGLKDPVSFAVSPTSLPTMYVVEDDGSSIYQYCYGGNSPVLGLSGLERVLSVSVYETGDIITLSESEIQTYAITDDSLVKIPALSIDGIVDPIAVAAGNNYEVALLTQDKVSWFSFTGAELTENPFMEITGTLVAPVTISATGQSLAVLDKGKVSLYEYSGSQNMAVMVTELTDLDSPQGVALRPGCMDMVVIDQKSTDCYDLRYFMFDGSEMVENVAISQSIENVLAGSGYMNKGWVVSKVVCTGSEDPSGVDWLRIRANIELPNNTGITWQITNTLDNWYPLWMAERSENGVLNIYKYINNEWVLYLGEKNDIYPKGVADDSFYPITTEPENDESKSLDQTLWLQMDKKDNNIRWKAEMHTNDRKATPKIILKDNLSVVWDVNTTPNPPIIVDPGGTDPDPVVSDEHDTDIGDDDPEDYKLPELERKEGWLYTTTPQFTWTFQDPDEDDYQLAYQFRLIDRNKITHENIDSIEEIEDAVVYDSGKRFSSENKHRIETSEDPSFRGPMWRTGGYQFAIQVRVWDKTGIPSPWSILTLDIQNIDSFNVLAFERPRIIGIVNPPVNGENNSPIKANSDTHKIIKEGAKKDELPEFRAGTWVTVRIDSVGPINPDDVRVVFRYCVGDKKYVIRSKYVEVAKTDKFGENHQFDLRFFTEAPIEYFPNGTVVKMYVGGNSVADVDAGKTIFFLPPYAEGVAVSNSTAYETWYIVLQGSEKE